MTWRCGDYLARTPTDKSFLVLFFKKEHPVFFGTSGA
jgi:hypothetical protein